MTTPSNHSPADSFGALLCAFTARTGDLDLRFTPAPSALEGMESHRLVQGRRGDGYEAEVALSGLFQQLTVRGRADGFDAARQQLEEIKTYRGQLDGVRPTSAPCTGPRPACTATCCARPGDWSACRWHWSMCKPARGKRPSWSKPTPPPTCQAHFEALCARYLAWAHSEQQHRQARDAALAALTFPHGSFRAGSASWPWPCTAT